MKSSDVPGWRRLLLWQLVTLGGTLLFPLVASGDWPWQLKRVDKVLLALLLAGFGLTCLLHWLIRAVRPGVARYVPALLSTVAVFAGVLLMLVIMRSTSSRTLLLGVLVMAIVFLPLPFAPPRLHGLTAALLALAIISVATAGIMHERKGTRAVKAGITQTYLSTNLYNLSLITHRGRIGHAAVRGGGFTKLGERLLLATGDGYLYLLNPHNETLDAQELPLRIPLNGEEFAKAVGGEYKQPVSGRQYGAGAPSLVQTWRFRVADILAQDLGDRVRLFASHHHWDGEKRCFSLRISSTELDPTTAAARAGWKTLFEATPCLPLSGPDAMRGKNPFQGEEIGGRMELLDARTILLTVGDMGFSGMDAWQRLAQDPGASYGKTLRVDLDSGKSELFTLGHRNPQGLYLDPNGEIWSTEHGSRGGDELNLLQAGVNYGWPNVTYGTDYQSFTWPLNPRQGAHEGYPKPVFAWVPSIGVSNLIRLSRDLFPAWQGDFLVGSLATRALYRLRVDGSRVVFSEPIAIEQRVRDLVELDDGRILVWTDTASLVEIRPTTDMNGALLFGAQCETCHKIYDGMTHRSGPDLFGIVDKEIASAPGFAYSPALGQLRGHWTPEQLDRFLTNPQAVAPGTTMAFAGITDEQQRKLIIDFLKKNED